MNIYTRQLILVTLIKKKANIGNFQVNKPTLPLTSGEYSPATGVAVVSVFAAMVTKLIMVPSYDFIFL
jgi:hypothetical protein